MELARRPATGLEPQHSGFICLETKHAVDAEAALLGQARCVNNIEKSSQGSTISTA